MHAVSVHNVGLGNPVLQAGIRTFFSDFYVKDSCLNSNQICIQVENRELEVYKDNIRY